MTKRLTVGAFLLLFAISSQADEPQAVTALRKLKQSPATTGFSWSSGTYQYDPAGNIWAIGGERFTYDQDSRLRSATVRGPDLSTYDTENYAVDAFGNLTSLSRSGHTTAFTVDTQTNHLLGNGISYNEAGQLEHWTAPGASGATSYEYDAAGMIRSLWADGDTWPDGGSWPRQAYVYTASDERLFTYELKTDTVHWTLRGTDAKELRQFDKVGSAWSWVRDYVYREGLLLASTGGGGQEHYTLDHLGTPRVVTDASKTEIGYHVYWPYGEEWMGQSATQGKLRFTGHERDAAVAGSALDYMHARYYASSAGRFLSVDPGRDSNTHQPQGWNMYGYVRNNPVLNRDPDGKVCIPCVGALIGGTVGLVAESYRQSRDVIVHGIPADNRKLAAAFAAGAVSGAIGASCGGCGLVMSTGAGLAGTTIGGVVGRALDGQHTAKQVVDGKEMLKDGAAGGIGGAVGYGVAKTTVEPIVEANKLGESAARESAMQNNLGQGFYEIVNKQQAVKDATALSVGVGTAVGETTSNITGANMPAQKGKERP